MEREEGNKAIAAFMERDFESEEKWIEDEDADSKRYPNGRRIPVPLTVDDLEYDTSWDSLMPVVEKIESTIINDEVKEPQVIILKNSCNILIASGSIDNYKELYCETSEGATKLEAAYKAVVSFISFIASKKI